MKFKLFFLSLCVAVSVNLVSAQESSKGFTPSENKHELRLSVSDGLTLGTTGILGNGLSDVVLGNKRSDEKMTMVFGLGYRYSIHRFRVGADLGFAQASSKLALAGEKAPSIKEKGLNFLVLPTAEFVYFKRNLFELYGGASVGVDLVRQSESKLDEKGKSASEKNSLSANLAYQVNPIAFRVGNDRIGGFMEAGFGHKGFLTAGVSLKF
jgi:hypothetical protein